MYLPKEYRNLYPAVKKKKNKYGAKKTWVDGHKFDSKKEAYRYKELKLMQHAGIISDLELQPKFLLQEKFSHKIEDCRAIKYIADFRYQRDGKEIIEDVKGRKTAVYQIKKKLLLKKYPNINFREV